MPHLSIRVLGPFQVTLDGEAVSGFTSDKVRALLAYLALAPERPHRREKLAGLLWPEFPERSARSGLRNALANLRQVIRDRDTSPPFLYSTHQTIQFNGQSDYGLDADTFDGLLAMVPPVSKGLEQAVSLVRGPFLEGFTLADAAPFEEWLLVRRERFGRQVLEALDSLAAIYEGHGAYEQALAHARRRVELEPWEEDGQRRLMRLLVGTSRRAEALTLYEGLRRELAEELGIELAPETTRLYELIRNGELDLPTVAPAQARDLELPARLPGFLEQETDAVEPPVFVARERQLARLDGFLETALAGQGRVVFVTGGPGRGKTALLDEFARRAMEAQPDLLVASGNCNAYSGIGDPYLPFRDVMGMLTGDVEAKWAAGAISRDHARRLWGALPLAVQALGDHGPHVVPALVPGAALLSRAMAVAPAGAPWLQRLRERVGRQPAGSEGLEQSALFQQVSNVLRNLAEAHPLLLVLDDLQWADSASVGLLFHLSRRLEGSRILIAGAYRPEEIALGRDGACPGPAVQSPDRARSSDRGRPFDRERHPLEELLAELKRRFGNVWLDLAEVQEPEGRQFVDALLATQPNRLGEDFRSELFARSGGHPLFTVELLRTMQERGDLVQDGVGYWMPGPAMDWEMLPPRAEGVIEARIGRLDEQLRELLSVACVEGEEFTAQVVARVLKVGERQVLRRLARELDKRHHLVREQLSLRVASQRLSRYRFGHALFQQYLYNDLSDGERTFLHGQIAAVLEALYEGSTETVAVQLAHHYSEAGDNPRALQYLALSGNRALASYANREAEGYYRRALELVPEESRRVQLLSRMGEALLRQSRFREAIQTWREGIELYRALQDSDGLARLYADSASAALQAYYPTESLRLCLEGLPLVQGAPESPGLARLLHRTARAYRTAALLEEGRPFAQRALEMAERLGDVEMQAHALTTLGGDFLTGEPALDALVKAVMLSESYGLPHLVPSPHHSLGYATMIYRGDYRAGLEYFLRGAELAGQAGRANVQMISLTGIVWYSLRYGEFAEAEKTLSRMRALLEELTEPSWATEAVLYCEMWYQGHMGKWEACIPQARARQVSARERGADNMLAWANHWLGWATLESRFLGHDVPAGGWEEADAALVEAIEIYDRSSMPMYGVEVRVWLGSLRVTQGRLGDARRLLAEARERATVQPVIFNEPLLLLLEAQLAIAEERWAEALAAFEAAVGILDRFGVHWYRARWFLDWAEVHAARREPGDLDQARELLRAAQAAFQEMGIMRYTMLVRDRLEALGAAAD